MPTAETPLISKVVSPSSRESFGNSFTEAPRGTFSASPRGRETSVWFDELQRLEDAGDVAFNRRRVPIFEKAKKPHAFSSDERKRMDNYESIDYIEPQSLIYKDHLRVVRTEKRWVKWAVYLAVGVVVGLWACLLFQTLSYLADTKRDTIENVVIQRNKDLLGPLENTNGTSNRLTVGGITVDAFFDGYAVHLMWAACAALLSSLCCLVMPSAAGSGVPDVMAYLNGVMFPRIFNIRNLVVKTLSCIFAVSSGLPVGAEGPMIHIGALIGAGLPTGRSRSLRCSATSLLSMFRNTKDHRDFISAGAACGVTSAFSSPIGGLLFVMEEVATFFPVKLAWMVFVSCLACMFTIQLINTYIEGWKATGEQGYDGGNFADSAITMFRVDHQHIERIPMNLMTFLPTFVVGVAMAFLSVLFVIVNLRVMRFRNQNIFPKPVLRVLEPSLFVIVYASLCYIVPIAFDCEPIPEFIKKNRDTLDIDLWTSFCADRDNEFHPLGTLTLTNSYNVIRVLFSRHVQDLFPWHALVIFQSIYTFGAMYAGGMFISSGIVIPTLVIGAIGGRLTGVIFGNAVWADAGVIALVGAAAFFGGLSRLTFSLVVIMMEITNDLTHMPCLMVGIIISKTIADKFCHSLYHAILEAKCVPFLEVQTQMHKLDTFCAKDIMTSPVVTLRTLEAFNRMVEVLQTTKHNSFPVVAASDDVSYRGMLQRRQIELLLWFIYFRDTEGRSFQYSAERRQHASYEELKEVGERLFWERLPTIPPVAQLSVATTESAIDLTPYIDLSAHYTRDVMCVSRSYYMFQHLALRHLPVVNRHNHVIGILTRKNFVGDRMYERMEEAAAKSKEALKNAARKKRAIQMLS